MQLHNDRAGLLPAQTLEAYTCLPLARILSWTHALRLASSLSKPKLEHLKTKHAYINLATVKAINIKPSIPKPKVLDMTGFVKEFFQDWTQLRCSASQHSVDPQTDFKNSGWRMYSSRISLASASALYEGNSQTVWGTTRAGSHSDASKRPDN